MCEKHCEIKKKTVFVITGMCQGGEVEGYWKEIENNNSDDNE